MVQVVEPSVTDGFITDTFEHDDLPDYPTTIMQLVQIGATHTAIKIVAKHPCARGRNGWKRGEKNQFMDWAGTSVQEFIPVS